MKVIVDAGFPPLDDIRCQAMHATLYKKKRRYAYKEYIDDDGHCRLIYFHFPKMNPFVFIYDYIKFYIKERLSRDNDNGTEEGEA